MIGIADRAFLIYTLLADFESYPLEDAKFVVAHINVNYDEQAVFLFHYFHLRTIVITIFCFGIFCF